MNLPALLDKFTALAGRIETAFASADATNARLSALTSERDNLASKLTALTTERDSLIAKVSGADALAAETAAKLADAETAKANAEAAAANAKAEADKLKANPSMQAAAILAGAGHSPLSAGGNASAGNRATIDPNLKGLARAKAARAAQTATR